jgi:hypothetical protein
LFWLTSENLKKESLFFRLRIFPVYPYTLGPADIFNTCKFLRDKESLVRYVRLFPTAINKGQ